MEVGTSTRGAGVEWDKEEGPEVGSTEAGSTEGEGADTETESGVSTGLGTTGSGEEAEKNEGSIEETKSKSDKEEVEGVSTLVEGGFGGGAGGENQADKEEEKGI